MERRYNKTLRRYEVKQPDGTWAAEGSEAGRSGGASESGGAAYGGSGGEQAEESARILNRNRGRTGGRQEGGAGSGGGLAGLARRTRQEREGSAETTVEKEATERRMKKHKENQ